MGEGYLRGVFSSKPENLFFFIKKRASERIVMKSNVVDPDLMDKYSEHNFSLSFSCVVLVSPVDSQFSLPQTS